MSEEGLVLNPKCLAFTAMTVGLYWVCPSKDTRYAYLMTAGIAIASYTWASRGMMNCTTAKTDCAQEREAFMLRYLDR